MRRIRTLPITARQAPPAWRVAVSQPVAGMLAAVAVVLVALACLTNTPIGPETAGPPVQSVVSRSLAAFQLAVLPVRHLDGGVVTADRPNPTPTAIHALLVSALTVSGYRRLRSRPLAVWLARRPSHRAAGGPRAPPSSPRPS